MDDIQIGLANSNTLPALGGIFEAAFDQPFGQPAVEDLLKPDYVSALAATLISTQPHPTVGYVIFSCLAEDAEILSIAVHPSYQKQGLGQRLLTEVSAHVLAKGAEKLFLEVAADNTAAQSLYRRTGFKQIGRRKKYYKRQASTYVDAIVMRKVFSANRFAGTHSLEDSQ